MTDNDNTQQEVVFAHPSEEQFSRILDFYRVRWEYEPRTFELRWDNDGNVVEAFSPDFYLPEQNLYIELTTMEQRLITKKHRKLRRLKKLHPNINIKLINRSDFKAMMLKYGLEEKDLIGQHPQQSQNKGD